MFNFPGPYRIKGAVNLSEVREREGTPPVPRLHFRALLACLMATVLLPSLTCGIIATFQELERERAAAAGRLLDNARALALGVGADIQARLQAVETLAASAAFDPGASLDDADQALRRASTVLGEPLALLSRDGTQLVHTAVPRELSVPATLHITELRRVIQTARPVVIDLHTGVVSHSIATAAFVPVIRNKHVVAVLAIRLEVDRLRAILTAQHLQGGSFASLIDSRHVVVARSDDRNAERVGKPAMIPNALDMDGQEARLYRGVVPDGERRALGFHTVPGAPGWLVFVAAPMASVDPGWSWPLLVCLAGGGLALGFGSWQALMVARHVLRPLEQLRKHALALAVARGEPVGNGAAALRPASVAELEALRLGFAAAEEALHRRAAAQRGISHALLSSEARLRDLMDTVDLGVFMAIDIDGTIQHWSAGCEKLYGFTSLEAIGQISRHLLQTHFPTPLAQIEAALEHQGSWTGELWHSTKDGRELIVSAHRVLRRSADGRASVLEVVIDTTAQRQAEATLSAVMDALPVGVAIADAKGRILHLNAANRALWGPAPETATWQDYGTWAGYWPDTGQRIQAEEWAMARALLKGETVQGELVEYEPFGSSERRFCINNAAPARDIAGNLIGAVAAMLDVTATRRAETRFAESEAQLRTVIATVPVGILLAEFPSGRIISGNAYVETLLRHPILYSPDVDSYDEWISYHADGTRVQGHEYPLGRMAMAGEENPSIEVLYQRGDGTKAWMRIMGRPVRDQQGHMIGGVVAIMDIDAERRAQTALEQLVQDRTEALRETEERLAHAAKMEALGRLAGGVAHDFNNILQVVQGSADLAARRLQTEPERAKTLLGLVVEAAARGMNVTSRLLAFARRGDVVAEAVPPAPMLEGLAQMLQHTMGPTVDLRIDAPNGIPALLADRGQLETVLVNLANNARDALPPEGGMIALAAELTTRAPAGLPPDKYVRLSVTDNGTGMSAAVLERVSEPFFTTKAKGKGTGLGLAMARGFVEQSGGALRIDSAIGEGTTVSLWLPLAASAVPSAVPQRRRTETSDAANGTVLLVDDNPDVRAVLADLLEDQGYAVIEAENAEMALQLLETRGRVDVLMTDLAMPGDLDGFGLIQAARRLYPALAAVVVTGHACETDLPAVQQASAEGPLVVLRKPVSSRTLQAGMAAAMRGDTGAGI